MVPTLVPDTQWDLKLDQFNLSISSTPTLDQLMARRWGQDQWPYSLGAFAPLRLKETCTPPSNTQTDNPCTLWGTTIRDLVFPCTTLTPPMALRQVHMVLGRTIKDSSYLEGL